MNFDATSFLAGLVLLIAVAVAFFAGRRGGGGTGNTPPAAAAAARSGGSGGFSRIADEYDTLEQVQAALRKAGLESSELIIGVDFTKSNTWTGERSFGGRSLHAVRAGAPNPYERAVSVIGRTLEAFDDDNLIPAFGFGDRRTTDKSVFALGEGGAPCRGFGEVLSQYRSAAGSVSLSGPTSFVPLIDQAVAAVRQTGAYHILLIVADGQVSNRQANADAIVRASDYALSIVMVGVGDGPWDEMEEFDDELPQRRFDNFQFVRADGHRNDASFALAALMEIPEQFKTIRKLGLLGGAAAPSAALLPPQPQAARGKKKDC
jgi:E3 ubiquitin-protein ligase RGLG